MADVLHNVARLRHEGVQLTVHLDRTEPAGGLRVPPRLPLRVRVWNKSVAYGLSGRHRRVFYEALRNESFDFYWCVQPS